MARFEKSPGVTPDHCRRLLEESRAERAKAIRLGLPAWAESYTNRIIALESLLVRIESGRY